MRANSPNLQKDRLLLKDYRTLLLDLLRGCEYLATRARSYMERWNLPVISRCELPIDLFPGAEPRHERLGSFCRGPQKECPLEMMSAS